MFKISAICVNIGKQMLLLFIYRVGQKWNHFTNY